MVKPTLRPTPAQMQEAEERELSVLICNALKNFEALGVPTSRTPDDWSVNPTQTTTSDYAESSTSYTKRFSPVTNSNSHSWYVPGDSKFAAAYKARMCAFFDRAAEERDRQVEEEMARRDVSRFQKDAKQLEREKAQMESINRAFSREIAIATKANSALRKGKQAEIDRLRGCPL